MDSPELENARTTIKYFLANKVGKMVSTQDYFDYITAIMLVQSNTVGRLQDRVADLEKTVKDMATLMREDR